MRLVLLSIVLISSGLLSSCSNGDDVKVNPNSIYGTWRIIANQTSSDNDFVDNDSGIYYDFDINGTVRTNGAQCTSDSFLNERSFNLQSQTITCSNNVLTYDFQGEHLIITYPCDPNCKQKFKKTANN